MVSPLTGGRSDSTGRLKGAVSTSSPSQFGSFASTSAMAPSSSGSPSTTRAPGVVVTSPVPSCNDTDTSPAWFVDWATGPPFTVPSGSLSPGPASSPSTIRPRGPRRRADGWRVVA
ncbi:MAG: hypothetical protein R2695_18925 [Acidimicrobiales bacterium]